ncbi:hypothetical protein HOY80DRAFT_71092 [Tuber brumale]|nr:hypothetical protein HOY80DRAFT_71092 [Tuber brumale]
MGNPNYCTYEYKYSHSHYFLLIFCVVVIAIFLIFLAGSFLSRARWVRMCLHRRANWPQWSVMAFSRCTGPCIYYTCCATGTLLLVRYSYREKLSIRLILHVCFLCQTRHSTGTTSSFH